MQAPSRGLSAVELMIVVAIVAVLATLAYSSYQHAKAKAATHTLREGILGALLRARSEATAREQVVMVCPSPNQMTCANSESWHQGLLVLVDQNGNGRADPADPRLFSQDDFGPFAHATSSRGRRLLKFHPNGGNAGSNVTFTFCDRRGPEHASALAMSNTGNYREVPATDAGIALACAGFP